MFQRLTTFFSTAMVMGVVMVSLANAAPAETHKSGMSTAQPTEFTGTVSTVDKKGIAIIKTDEGQQHKMKNHGWQAGDKVSCAKKSNAMTCTKTS